MKVLLTCIGTRRLFALIIFMPRLMAVKHGVIASTCVIIQCPLHLPMNSTFRFPWIALSTLLQIKNYNSTSFLPLYRVKVMVIVYSQCLKILVRI